MSAPSHTGAQLLAQMEAASKNVAELRRLFPGCFNPDGTAIVASAHFDRASETDATKQKPRS